MNKYLKTSLIIILTIILIVIFAIPFGNLYISISGDKGGSWIGSTEFWTYISGLFTSYVFFIPLMLTIFGGKKKYLIMAILVAIELLFFFGSWEAFIIDAVAAIIGWLLGEGILFAYKKLAPAKPAVKIKSVKK